MAVNLIGVWTVGDGIFTRTGIIHYNDFESTTFGAGYGYDAPSGSITRSSTVSRTDLYSVRFVLNDTDPFAAGSTRAELNLSGPENNGEFTQRKHWWVGLSTYLDPGTYNTVDTNSESIWQFHHTPNFAEGQTWGSYKMQNPYSLQIDDGVYKFYLHYDPTKSRTSTTNDVVSSMFNLGTATPGVWVDWVIHMYPDYNNGIMEIWKDGVKVVDVTGNTYYNDETGPYMKMGIYKWVWSTQEGRDSSPVSTRILYVDELRWGDASSNYNSVSP